MGHGTSFRPPSLVFYNCDPTASGLERVNVSIRHAENSASSINASDPTEELEGRITSGVYWSSGTTVLTLQNSADTLYSSNYITISRYKNSVAYGMYVFRYKWKYYYSSGLHINKTNRGTTDFNVWVWDSTDARVSGDGLDDAMFAQTSTVSFTYSSSSDDVTALITQIDNGGISLKAPTGATCTTLNEISYTKNSGTSVTVTLSVGMNASQSIPLISRVYATKLLSSSLFTIFQRENDVTVKIVADNGCFYVGSSLTAKYSATTYGSRSIYATGSSFTVTMYRNGAEIKSTIVSYEDDMSKSTLYESFSTNNVETNVCEATHTISASGGFAFTILLTAYDSAESNGWAELEFVCISGSESTYYGNYDSEEPLSFGRYAAETLIAALPDECGISQYDVPVSASVSECPYARYYGKSTVETVTDKNSPNYGASVTTVDTRYSGATGYTQLAYSDYFSVKYLGRSSSGGYLLSISLSKRRPAFTYPPIPLDTFVLPSESTIPIPGTAADWTDVYSYDSSATIKVRFTSGRYIGLTLSHETPTSVLLSTVSKIINADDFCAIARSVLGAKSTDSITVDSFKITTLIRGESLAESIKFGGDNITLTSLNSYTQSLYVSSATNSSTTSVELLLRVTAKGIVSVNGVTQTASNSSVVSAPPVFPSSSAEWDGEYLAVSWNTSTTFNVNQSAPAATITTSSADDLLDTPVKLL